MISSLLAFITAFITLQLLLKSPLRRWIVAYAEERSMHVGAMPRFGGIGIILGITVGWLVLGVDSWWLLLILGLSVAGVSLLDDLFDLPVWIRLFAQVGMAAAFIYLEYSFINIWLAVLITMAIVWMVNLYNFMDGIDGLAGGMAVFGFSAFAVAAYLVALDIVMLKAAFVVVAASLAFLRWNLFPSSMFLGDVGSTSIGFIAAAFSFYGWREGMWPFWFPAIVFLPFIADATVTLLKRLFNRENIFQPHNKHYYQRLVRMGWSQPAVSITWYVAMLLSAAVAIALLHVNVYLQWLGLLALFMLVGLVFIFVDISWQTHVQNEMLKQVELEGKAQATDLKPTYDPKKATKPSLGRL